MQGELTAPKILRFGSYAVDLAAGLLQKGGARVRLRDQSFQVLAALLERPGQVVTREELRRRLWPGDVFVDFDNNLNTAIARLREALSDSPDRPRFIETLPKHGYRFIASVFEPPSVPEPPKAAHVRLVVLPFLNLSGDSGQEYFSDAMTDELITALGGLAPEQLAVIARTTAMHYKCSRKDVTRISRELGVDYVVEGAVRRTDGRDGHMTLNVQLIRAADQTHLWAHRFDAALSEIFNLQEAIAQAIALNIGVRHVPGAHTAAGMTIRRKPTDDLVAYNEFIQGRHRMGRLSPDAFSNAKPHFERAVARDPGFALAYDSLAEVYWWQAYFGFVRPLEALSKGVLFASRALEIDNTLAETHALLALFHKQLDYNWPEVEREMARAMALNPRSALVRMRYAFNVLMPYGRLEEAAAELESALELDPFSTFHRTALLVTLVVWRRYDRTLTECQKVLELDPQAYWAHLIQGSCYRDLGRFEEAIAANRRAVETSGGSAATLGWLGLTLGLAGETAEPRALLRRLSKMSLQGYVPPTSFAWIYLGLREYDSAFEWLDRAVEERDQYMMPIKGYAFLDPIRGDPCFRALLHKMHLET